MGNIRTLTRTERLRIPYLVNSKRESGSMNSGMWQEHRRAPKFEMKAVQLVDKYSSLIYRKVSTILKRNMLIFNLFNYYWNKNNNNNKIIITFIESLSPSSAGLKAICTNVGDQVYFHGMHQLWVLITQTYRHADTLHSKLFLKNRMYTALHPLSNEGSNRFITKRKENNNKKGD